MSISAADGFANADDTALSLPPVTVHHDAEDGTRFYTARDVLRLSPRKYIRWINDPRTPRVDEVRLYGSSRRLNRLLNHWPWWLPLTVWPATIAVLLRGAGATRLQWFALACAVFFPFEYLMHRFVFHLGVTNKILQRIHLTMHGGHHLAPSDAGRLAMHPVMVLFVLAIIGGMAALVPGSDPRGFVAGIALQYLRYDMTHCAVHLHRYRVLSRVPLLGGFLAACKRNHMRHHFVDANKYFPISFVVPSLD